jgi:hypothetical protein
MRIRQFTATATLAAAAVLLSACGGGPLDGKNGSQVATAAADALEAAGSVHIQGTMEQNGQEGEVDLHLQGDDVTGTITIGGVEIQLLNVGGQIYMQAPADFWASSGMPEGLAAMFVDKWVAVPSDAASDFEELSLAGMIDSFRTPSSEVKDDVRQDEVDGEDVVIVEQEDGSTLTVANDDRSYPLELANEGDQAGTMTFSRFGEKEEITAPEDAVDLEELMGGA